MLNQSISTPVQHPHHNTNGTDLGMNGNYVQQQRQQQSQMSGSYQRPSNGSNILEQHAMRPATTADPSNCVFNDQESSINGILRNDGIQMQQPNMMGMQTHSMQQNQMAANNSLTTGNTTRLPSLTLSSNNSFSVSSNIRNQQNGQNEFQNQQSFQQNMIHVENSQQSQQTSQRPYDQSICHNKGSSMTMKEQQLFGQQSMNSQQMVTPPRMNTPVLNHQQNIQPQNVQQQTMQPIQQQTNLQSNMHQSNMQQPQNVQQQPPRQQQNRMQSGMQQRQNVHQQNVQQSNMHNQTLNVRQHLQQTQNGQQHNIVQQQNVQQSHRSQQQNMQGMQTQNIQKPLMQQSNVQQQNMQQSGMQQQQGFQQRNVQPPNGQQQRSGVQRANMQQTNVQQQNMQQQNFQQQNVQQQPSQHHKAQQSNMQHQQNSQQQQQQVVYQQNAQSHCDLNQMNTQQSVFTQQKSNNHQSMSQVQNGSRIVPSFQQNPPSDQMSHLSHMDPPPTQHSMNSVPQSQLQQHSNQMNANSTQMIGVQSQVQSPTDMSLTPSIASPPRISQMAFGNNTSQTISQSNIPMNANSTTQILMALNSNSPITAEQLTEIQRMTCTGPDGSQILLMQEPRLKQYSSLKEMSTNDLRNECKKRTLASAGTKMRLSERLAEYETEVLDERNQQLMMEYTHRQQMYEAQAATLKAFQAKKASLQVQSNQNQNMNGPVVSSNEISSTTQSMPTLTQQTEGPPPAKKRRATKSKKTQQQQEKQKGHLNVANSNSEPVTIIGTVDNAIINMVASNTQPLNIGSVGNNGSNGSHGNTPTNGNIGSQGSQNSSSSNIFGNVNQPGSGFFMKDNTCFSHLGSGCRLISTNSDDGQNSSYSGRAFPLPVPPPPEDNQVQFQSMERQSFATTDPISQPQLNAQSRPINLNQQQSIGTNNTPNSNSDSVNSHIANMFNPSPINTNQQQNQQQSQQNFMNPMPQNGLQSSPCAADQAGSSPNMPVNDTLATTSDSPMLASSVSESSYTSEMMDIETMQQLLSPETLRAREELLTQQQAKINELVTLIQKHHDTLREQQQQINLAKRQQKLRQRQSSQPACAIEKQVNSRSLEHVIKSRQNFQVLNDLTKQQDSIRTAETRLIEQLHINNATDDIARLIKQDGRTALVIVSLLHHYRTTREQNNQPKSTDDSAVPDKTTDGTKKKAPARKRTNNGSKVSSQNKKSSQQQPDIEVVQVISPRNGQALKDSKTKSQSDSSNSQQTTSDINMDAIFEIVINSTDGPKPKKAVEPQVNQQQYDNEVISLPSEGSSPTQMQTLNSTQSGFSDGFNSKNIVYQENSPQQQTAFITNMDNGNSSAYSPDDMLSSQNETVSQHFSMTKQPEVMDVLPQLEQHSIEQELGNHQFADTFHFSDDSNQGFFDQNCQNNFDQSAIYSETAFDQLVADFRTNPPNCEEDGDLNKILNSFDNYGNDESENNKDMQQEAVDLCDLFDQHNSLDMEQFQSFDWNEFDAQSNIINQAFEQSEMN